MKPSSDKSEKALDRIVEQIKCMNVPEFPNPEVDFVDFKVPIRRVWTTGLKLAFAGLAAVILVFVFVNLTGETSPLAAQTQDAFREVESVSYTIVSLRGKTKETTKVFCRADGWMRAEQDGTTFIFDSNGKRMLELRTKNKEAILTEGIEKASRMNILAWFASLERSSSRVLSKYDEKPRSFGDIEASSFTIKKPYGKYRVWINPKTKLPIELSFESEKSSEQPPVRETWKDFTYNGRKDRSLFSLDVPKGYHLSKVQLKTETKQNGKDLGAKERRRFEQKTMAMSIDPRKGVGKVHLGMSSKQVIEILGKPDRHHKSPQHSQETLDYLNLGLHLTFDTRKLGLRTIICMSSDMHTLRSFHTKPNVTFQGRLPGNIRIGSDFKEVEKQLGKPRVSEGYMDRNWSRDSLVEHAYNYDSRDFSLMVITKDEKIVEFHIGHIEWKGYHANDLPK